MAQQSSMEGPMRTALGVQDIYTVSATQKMPLGTKAQLSDGRAFVYGKAGAADLAYGLLAMTRATDANHQDEVVAATAAIGATSISVTFGAAVAANLFAGGYLNVNDDTGEGNLYTIVSHPAGTAGVIVQLGEKIRVAVTAAAGTVSAIKHPCADLIISAATAGAPVGVPMVTIPATNFGWFQVTGVASVLTAGVVVIGQSCVQAAGGAVAPNAGDILPPLGAVLQVSATTEYSLINLAVPGF